MSWTTASNDLRVLLSDGSTDKLRAFKAVFGAQDGTNKIFKTFEFRRITDFSASGNANPLGIYIDNVLQAPSAVSWDDLSSGNFALETAPTDAQQILCSYYIQWFTDSELEGFLTRSSNWLGFNDDYANIPSGLKTAALKYASHEAYLKLSLRFAENIVETYRLQDAPDEKRMSVVSAYQQAAKDALKDAYKSRDDYYSRKGRSLAPLFDTVQGNIKNPTRG